MSEIGVQLQSARHLQFYDQFTQLLYLKTQYLVGFLLWWQLCSLFC